MVGEDSNQIAARIAKKLRDTGTSCEIFNPAITSAAVLRRDRVVILVALASLTVLAWSYLLWLASDMNMDGMDMTGFRTIPSGMGLMMPAQTPWRAMEFAFVFVMWTVMMIGMMTPSAAPMILMYARVGRQSEAHSPLAATAWFGAGYFLVWAGFSLLATLVQWALEQVALLDSAMASTSNVVGGLLFVAAGSYQCWALMMLLFVGGVMNVYWILALAIGILLEKVTSFGRLIAPAAGTALIAAGVWLFATAIHIG
jgi:predicted metal-binding membrane protein